MIQIRVEGHFHCIVCELHEDTICIAVLTSNYIWDAYFSFVQLYQILNAELYAFIINATLHTCTILYTLSVPYTKRDN